VVIPARPLNRKGWIPASAARVKPTVKRIVVNRSTHWLQVYNGNKRVFRTRVATGRSDRPTPLGLFYVAAKYRPPFNALVTAYALELSAPAGLPDFALGGVIGIHGTPAVSTLGYNASNGCIRVAPSAAIRLKQIIPAGTPVRVVN
jgi:lipoprotein-anchoring transpeptidase ErfK/SrfK